MASCDLCGKPATTRARIEGIVMSACASCASFGTEVKAAPKPLVRAPASPRAPVSTIPDKELALDFGKRLHAARERLRLEPEEAAMRLQLHKSTLLHYEAGKMAPDETTARRLERFYGISLFE